MESQPALAVVQCGDRRAGLEALVPGLDGSVALDRRFLAGAAALAEVLPPDVRDPCVGCATGVGPAAIWLRDLPAPLALPPTPSDPRRPPLREDVFAELWLSAIGALMGSPVAYGQVGAVFRHLVPSTSGSCRPIRYRTAESRNPEPPDHLLLWCHRGDRSAVVRLASVQQALRWLDPRDVDVLSQPAFRRGGEPTRVLDAETRELVAWHPRHLQALGGAPREALHRLGQAFEWATELLILQPGDLLVLDNHRVVHGLTAYPARNDGTDLWLQRMATRRASAEARATLAS